MENIRFCCNDEYLIVKTSEPSKKLNQFTLIRFSTGEIVHNIVDSFDESVNIKTFAFYDGSSKSKMAVFSGYAMHLFELPSGNKLAHVACPFTTVTQNARQHIKIGKSHVCFQ